MGNKINPTGFRLANRLNWKDLWNTSKADYAKTYKNSIELRNYTKILAKCLGHCYDNLTIIKPFKKDYRIFSNIILQSNLMNESPTVFKYNLDILNKLNGSNKLNYFNLYKSMLEQSSSYQKQDYPIITGQLLSDFIADNLNSKGRFKSITFKKRNLQKSLSMIVYNLIKNFNIRNINGIKIIVSGRWQKTKSGRKQKMVINLGELKKSSVATLLSYGYSSAITKYGSNGIKVYIRYARIS